MVMAAFSAPREWSAALTAGKSEGTSGPGVGSRVMLLQAGWVGWGVGMMMVVAVGTALGMLGNVAGAQEQRRNKGMMKKYKNDFCIDFQMIPSLLDCCLEFLEGGHPGYAVDKVRQRSALRP